MTKFFLSVFFLTLYLQPLLAGGRVGNGANLVVCPDRDLQLLDFYEMSPNSLHLREFNGVDESDILEEVFKQLESLDSIRAERYRGWYKTFETEADRIDPFTYEVSDTGRIWPLQPGCKLSLSVYQVHVPTPLGKRYFISKSLWSQIKSPVIKAGVILHELILRDFLQREIQTTEGVRFFHNWIFSQEFLSMSDGEYENLIKGLGLISLEAPRKVIELYSYFDNYVGGKNFLISNFAKSPQDLVTTSRTYGSPSMVGRTLSLEIQDDVLSTLKDNESGDSHLKRRRIVSRLVCKLLHTDDHIYCENSVLQDSEGSSTIGSKAGTIELKGGKLLINLASIRPEDYLFEGKTYIESKIQSFDQIEIMEGKVQISSMTNIFRLSDMKPLSSLKLTTKE